MKERLVNGTSGTSLTLSSGPYHYLQVHLHYNHLPFFLEKIKKKMKAKVSKRKSKKNNKIMNDMKTVPGRGNLSFFLTLFSSFSLSLLLSHSPHFLLLHLYIFINCNIDNKSEEEKKNGAKPNCPLLLIQLPFGLAF